MTKQVAIKFAYWRLKNSVHLTRGNGATLFNPPASPNPAGADLPAPNCAPL
jgi:hypothetical protein